MTQLELLSNELLLEIFEYLNTTHLIRAFSGLNDRFNHLFNAHLRDYQLSFQSISRENLDLICEQCLPNIINQVCSLNLSNNEITDAVELLFFRGFTLDRFTHLRSLSLYNIRSLNQLSKITFQCRSLPHLVHLTIIKYHISWNMEYLFPESLNNIWSISTLTHCNLNGIQRSERWIPKISSISTSIEYISLEHSVFEMPSLSHLFHCTPHLKSLSLFASSTYSDVPMDCVIPSMKSLKIHYETLIDSLQYIFQTMPNLRHLTIDTRRMYFDGYEWEQIITNYLPKLKIFRLKMDLSPEMHMNIMTKNVDELLLTYRTTFWLEEHRWFIQCDYDSESLQPIMVYTLPYAFHNYRYSNKHCSKSTCPNEENYWSYDSVETISRNNNEKTLFNAYILRHPRFPSIRHLEIRLPLDDCFSLLFPSLNRLTSLNVDYFNDVSYSQLQMLIDQAPFLYSLKLDPRQRLHSQLFQLTSKSIRRLDIKFNPSAYSYKFSAEDCMNLINSPLGFQCEVLYIDVSSRNGALDLIYKMPNLRLLVFKSEDDQFFKNSSFLPTNDELAQWLRDHLPSSYTTFRDPRSFETRVWIDRQNRKHVLPSNDGVTTTWQNKFSGFLSTIKQFFS